MLWRAGARCDRVDRKRMPDDGCDPAVEAEAGRDLGRLDRSAGMQHATERAAALLGALRHSGLVILTCPAAAAMADGGRQRIGCGNARSPTGRNRRKNLHRQRNQDYGQKFLEPPAHRYTIRRSA